MKKIGFILLTSILLTTNAQALTCKNEHYKIQINFGNIPRETGIESTNITTISDGLSITYYTPYIMIKKISTVGCFEKKTFLKTTFPNGGSLEIIHSHGRPGTRCEGLISSYVNFLLNPESKLQSFYCIKEPYIL